nr:MAG TPA: hypothetical protein [Riboviria sp.]
MFRKHEFINALKDAVNYGCTQPISMIVQHKLDEESRRELLQFLDQLDSDKDR